MADMANSRVDFGGHLSREDLITSFCTRLALAPLMDSRCLKLFLHGFVGPLPYENLIESLSARWPRLPLWKLSAAGCLEGRVDFKHKLVRTRKGQEHSHECTSC